MNNKGIRADKQSMQHWNMSLHSNRGTVNILTKPTTSRISQKGREHTPFIPGSSTLGVMTTKVINLSSVYYSQLGSSFCLRLALPPLSNYVFWKNIDTVLCRVYVLM